VDGVPVQGLGYAPAVYDYETGFTHWFWRGWWIVGNEWEEGRFVTESGWESVEKKDEEAKRK